MRSSARGIIPCPASLPGPPPARVLTGAPAGVVEDDAQRVALAAAHAAQPVPHVHAMEAAGRARAWRVVNSTRSPWSGVSSTSARIARARALLDQQRTRRPMSTRAAERNQRLEREGHRAPIRPGGGSCTRHSRYRSTSGVGRVWPARAHCCRGLEDSRTARPT